MQIVLYYSFLTMFFFIIIFTTGNFDILHLKSIIFVHFKISITFNTTSFFTYLIRELLVFKEDTKSKSVLKIWLLPV